MATTAQNRNVVVVGIDAPRILMAGYSQPEYSFTTAASLSFAFLESATDVGSLEGYTSRSK
jgi:hypothetical protein